jgi:bifunctional DNA-binding transcriptional regulator/antitoxin component of YhaV-PrlF toxin-antitoxin module
MAKVTSKLQVTLPKVLAERYDIEPGDEIAELCSEDFQHDRLYGTVRAVNPFV